MSYLTDEQTKEILAWLAKHPFAIYGDYRDQIPDSICEKLVNDRDLESFDEWLMECEQNATDYGLSEYADDIVKTFARDWQLDEESDEYEDTVDEIKQLVFENYETDSSDFLRTCYNSTKPHIAATILDSEGNPYEFPHSYLDRDENARRIRALRKIGIRNPWKAETMYEYDCLKVIGTIDMREFVENIAKERKLKGITIGSQGYALTHNSYNGAGGLGDVVIRGQHDVACSLRFDESHRYGVQAVFGFVESCWRDELALIWE